jgi:hypothetical protein
MVPEAEPQVTNLSTRGQGGRAPSQDLPSLFRPVLALPSL